MTLPPSPIRHYLSFRFSAAVQFGAVILATSHLFAAPTDLDFPKDVLPVLSDKCFVCHGPDTHDDTDLKLDSFENATQDLGGYFAINKDDLGESELIKRINSEDDPMPPLDAEKQLNETEKQLLAQWVRSGGKYKQHWAFVKPTREDANHSIDDFISKRLETEKLDFASEADKATLARRAALVLTGLPPEPEQLQRYLNNQDANAYGQLVDELLQSPRFGEHNARYWLDAVRYGDTHGLHLDNRRGIYPYRDWVVRALNSNLPYDKFIEWQLAGDLLPEPSQEQLLATGYVRLNPSTGEGGAIAAEFQAKNNFDRVETFGTVFLGMSLTCARCHTHKYDPIPQTEYYQLMAYFNSTSENALDGNSYTYGAHIRTPDDQHSWAEWQTLLSKRDELLAIVAKSIDQERETKLLDYANARKSWKTSGWQITKPYKLTDGADAENKQKPTPEFSETKSFPGRVEGRAARKIVPKNGQLVKLRFVLELPAEQSLWFTSSGAAGSNLALLKKVDSTTSEKVEHQSSDAEASDNEETTGADEVITEPKIQAESDRAFGSSTVEATATTVAAVLWKTDESAKESTAIFSLGEGKHLLELTIVGSDSTDGIIAELKEPWAGIAKAVSWQDSSADLKIQAIADPNGPLTGFDVSPKLTDLATRINAIEATFTTSLIAKELEKPRETKLLHRGEYDAPRGDALEPGILSVLGALPETAPSNRLGLSKWLTSEEQPLVSRVLINRIWQQIFGYGLVRTPEDFGLQGQQPTHPELLDWLAVEFRESEWDYKHMIRLMVMSRTFRQDSRFRPEVDDPENRLYARGPSYRLDAEIIRDVALWASELLDPRMGGEGVKPYQPVGMWKALAHPASNTKQYERDSGNKLYRRSLYVYWKRTSPHPMMTLFDAPDRESSCVKRSRTNTPLQSLALFNETQRVEMSRKLASRLIKSQDTNDQRLNDLFGLLACRDPSETEQSICNKLLQSELQRFKDAPQDATKLLKTGEASSEPDLDQAELAAWTQLCSTILASDLSLLLY